jgi:hypothetical protein
MNACAHPHTVTQINQIYEHIYSNFGIKIYITTKWVNACP